MFRHILYYVTSVFLLLHPYVCYSTDYKPDKETEKRIEALLGKMTLEEKIGQMNQLHCENFPYLKTETRKGRVGSVMSITDPNIFNEVQRIAVEDSRLGIPLINARDVIHGFKTIFPIPLGQAASFNPEIAETGARIAATEASAAGIRWTFAPMIDITHDPRWGRIAEGFGEDPLLVSQMGVAAIKGFQGSSLNHPTSIAACAKHFAGYGASEGGRDYNEWNYRGTVVSDWASVSEMIRHGFCEDEKEAALKATNAGTDIEMVSETYIKYLPQLIKEGKVSMETIDNAVRNILRLKFRLGLFEHPYIADQRKETFYRPDFLEAAQTAAEQSAVLLKNERGTLPIQSNIKTILVTGPLADAPHEQLGTWVFDGDASYSQTPLQALRRISGDSIKVLYAPGLNYSRDTVTSQFNKVVELAREADLILAFVGEEAILSGEAHCLANLNLQGAQSGLLHRLSETGKPLVTVVMAGRPLTIGREVNISDALLYAFHPGTMGGPALANLLFGKVVPSGKLPVTFPKETGQIPIYYNHTSTGRPASGSEKNIFTIPVGAEQTSLGNTSFYLDAGKDPLFPFGYGLSYTTFAYSNLQLSSTQYTRNEVIIITFDLTNTGKTDGTEIAQLYFRDLAASVTRPVKELAAFERIHLKAGETRHIRMELPVKQLSFWNYAMDYCVEPGKFDLWIGGNSREGLKATFNITQ